MPRPPSILRAFARSNYRYCARPHAIFCKNAPGVARAALRRILLRESMVAGRLRALQRIARTLRRNPWNSWPEEIARRKPEALAQLRADLEDQLALERFLQFAFFEQWKVAAQPIVLTAASESSATSPSSSATTAPTSGPTRRFFACETTSRPTSSPVARPTPSARPVSAGAIRCMTGRP